MFKTLISGRLTNKFNLQMINFIEKDRSIHIYIPTGFSFQNNQV